MHVTLHWFFFLKYFDKNWVVRSERDEQMKMLSRETTLFNLLLESIYKCGCFSKLNTKMEV